MQQFEIQFTEMEDVTSIKDTVQQQYVQRAQMHLTD